MDSKRKIKWGCWLMTTVFISLFIKSYGSYYSEYEGIIANLIRGIWFDNSNNWEGWYHDQGFILIPAFSYLSENFNIPLWGATQLLLIFAGIAFLNLILLTELKRHAFLSYLIAFPISFFLFSFFLLNVTSVSTVFVALFPSLYLLTQNEKYQVNKHLLYVVIGVSMCLRMQTLLFVLPLVVFFSLINNSLTYSALQRLKTLGFIYAIAYLIFSAGWEFSDNYGVRFLNEFELDLLDRANINTPYAGCDSLTHIRYAALTENYFLDAETMPIGYLKDLKKYDTTIEYLLHCYEFKDSYVARLNRIFHAIILTKFWKVAMVLFLLILILSLVAQRFRFLLINVATAGYFFSILVLFTFFIRIEERFYKPFLIILLFQLLFSIVLLLEREIKLSRAAALAIYVCLGLFVMLARYDTVQENSKKLDEGHMQLMQVYSVIDSIAMDKKVYVIEPPWEVLYNRKLLSSPRGIGNEGIIIMQHDVLTYLPPVTAKIQKYCTGSPDAWNTKIQLLIADSGNSYILTNSGYTHFLIEYFKVFYNVELVINKHWDDSAHTFEKCDMELVSFHAKKIRES